MNIIEAEKLSKTYPGSSIAAVKDFSLQLNKGEMLALLGESGCGKTTVLRMIAGFERPDSGSLMVYGKKLFEAGFFVEPEKRNIGIVFQDHALFPHLRVAQNIGFGLQGLTNTDATRRIGNLLEITGLEGLGKRYPHQLSGGQQQRVALARALAPEPGLILLDEPFSSIDTVFRNKLRQEIRDILHQTGTTALLVTHDTKDALAIADRVVVMRNGIAVQTGCPAEVYTKPLNTYVADFFGHANYIRIEPGDHNMNQLLGIDSHSINEACTFCIRPDAIRILREKTHNTVEAKVLQWRFMGETIEVQCSVTLSGKPVQLTVYGGKDFMPGTKTCFLQFDSKSFSLIKG